MRAPYVPGHGQYSGALTPSGSHGPSPTPSSSSGSGFGRVNKMARMRGAPGSGAQSKMAPSVSQMGAHAPTSPAKNRGSGAKDSSNLRSPSAGSGSSGIGSSSGATTNSSSTSSRNKAPNFRSPGGGHGGPHAHHNFAPNMAAKGEDSEESGIGGHEDDDEMQQLLVELLSLIRTPKVRGNCRET